MSITKSQIVEELARQPHRIWWTEVDGKLHLQDISEGKRGVHLSFVSVVGLGDGFVELQFNEELELIKTLVEAS